MASDSSLSHLVTPIRRQTAAEQVAHVLRQAIIAGQFDDGEQLNQAALAKHFSVSRLPIREALRQLQAEGLIRAERHRPAVVIGFNRRHIADAFEIRALLESWLLERAAPALGTDALTELERRCTELEEIEDPVEWLERKHAFHHALLAPAGSNTASAVIDQLMSQVERYVRRAGGVGRRREVNRSYARILAALRAGDVGEAQEILGRLNRETGVFVLSTLGDGGPAGAGETGA